MTLLYTSRSFADEMGLYKEDSIIKALATGDSAAPATFEGVTHSKDVLVEPVTAEGYQLKPV